MEQARREVKHMTDAKYRIYMRRIGENEILKEKEYDNGGVQDALATMSAWVQDAQTVANVLNRTIYVALEGTGGVIVTASAYVDPMRKQ